NLGPVVATLLHLVQQIQQHQIKNLGDLPDGLQTSRVGNAFDDLSDQLTTLISLTQQVGRDLPPPEHGLLVFPPVIDFGDVHLNNVATQLVTIANNSSQTLVSVNLSATPNEFQVVPNSLAGPLAPNASSAVSVLFSPVAPGQLQGTLSITAGGQTTVVPLK